MVLTISNFFNWKELPEHGNVIHGAVMATGDYANPYAGIPQAVPVFQSIEIPVDNSEFSTFSTGFSTGVIHSRLLLWIFIFGSHKINNRKMETAHFLGNGGFY